VLYVFGTAPGHRTGLDVGTLVFVAVTIRAVRNGFLQVFVRATAYDLVQGFDL
jgi:hypothetical protein